MFLNGQHKIQNFCMSVGGGYYMYSLSQKFSRILISSWTTNNFWMLAKPKREKYEILSRIV